MGRDRLDGSKRGYWLYELYVLPGRTILWLHYMQPEKGRIRQSDRIARSPIMTFFYATGFWAFITFTLLFFCYKWSENEKLIHSKSRASQNHSSDARKGVPLRAIPVTDDDFRRK